MKTKSLLFAVGLFAVCAFSSCNDDDYVPEDQVVNAFNKKYPQAMRVEWETKAGYKVVDFVLDTNEAEAWFETDGNWVMTETDILFIHLPQAILDSFKTSAYGDWRVDDVDKLERFDAETVYVIEVEKGKEEYDLYYTEDGILVKEVNDNLSNHHPQVIPETVIDQVKAMYPNAVVLEYEREGTYLEIDIRDGKIHKEVFFDKDNQWVKTEWDIRLSEVPEVVTNALKASEYGGYKIDDVEIRETPDEMFYVFELENGDKDVYVYFKPDGSLVK